jgi:ABC-type bacteriocin/lantibiotic exporter with double-glycine peptidase domain
VKIPLSVKIIDHLSDRLQKKFNPAEVSDLYRSFSEYPGEASPQQLFNELNDVGSHVLLVFQEQGVREAEFLQMLDMRVLPILAFRGQDAPKPILVFATSPQQVEVLAVGEPGASPEWMDPRELASELYREEDRLYVVTHVQVDPTYSQPDGQHLSPVKRLWRLFFAERKDIFFVYLYAIAVGLLSLTTPLGVQAIIGLISGGLILEPVVVLIGFVIVGTLLSGVLQVLQVSIVESIKQRVFAKAAFEFAFRMPRIRTDSLKDKYAPELMNRFFEVLTIQKGFSKILTDVLSSLLQVLFGLLLLAFYHPFFIFFGALLILLLYLIFRSTGPRGLETSLLESKYKYKVVQWIEEVARTVTTFKLAGHTSLNIQKVDTEVAHYLDKRKAHFRVLMVQYVSVVAFKVLITGGILILGSLLVINNQITLGQFVASEIVIISVLLAVEKIILSLDVIYDVLTAVDKIGHVTDLPLEETHGHIIQEPACGTDTRQIPGFAIQLKDLHYQYEGHVALQAINLDIAQGQIIGITGPAGSGKTTLLNVISGLLDDYTGIVAYNGFSMRDINLTSLRDNIGDALGTQDIIYGTIEENISMGKNRLSFDQIQWALEQVELSDWVNRQPKGIRTVLLSGGKNLEATTIRKLLLARSIVEMPRLIVLDEFFNNLDPDYSRRMMQFLTARQHGWTLIAATRNPYFLSCCDVVVMLDQGEIALGGSYKEVKKSARFKAFYGEEA